MTATTPLWGKLGDLVDQKRLLQVALGVFVLGSLAAGFAPSMELLIAARALMGAAAACVLPPALSLIAVMFPPEERPRALGVWAGAAARSLF